MSYVIVLADRIHEANRYAKQVKLPKGRWRFPSSAGAIRGLKVAEIHELPSFAIRRDRFAIDAQLRYTRGERKLVFERPELDDVLLDEAYFENDAINYPSRYLTGTDFDPSAISAADIGMQSITTDKILANAITVGTIGVDPRGSLTERQLEVAYRYNALRELGLDALGDPDDTEPDPTAPVEKPKQRRRSKCPTCGEMDFKETHACPVTMRPAPNSMFD